MIHLRSELNARVCLALIGIAAAVTCAAAGERGVQSAGPQDAVSRDATTEPVRPADKALSRAHGPIALQEPLAAVPAGPTEIDIFWTLDARSANALVPISIWRSADHERWGLAARVPAGTDRYSDKNLAEHAIYFYSLSAADAPAAPHYNNDTFAITIPKTPHYLAAIPFDRDVMLTWNAVQGADGYEILGSPDGKSFHVIGAVDDKTTSYRDWSAADGVTDYYQVHAFNLFGNFAPTKVASATPIAKIREKEWSPDDDVALTVAHGQRLSIGTKDLFARAVDPNNDPVMQFHSFQHPAHGKVKNTGRGMLVYTSDAGYVGPDSFTYLLTDQYDAPSATLTIKIAVTDAPPASISGRIPVVGATDAKGARLSYPGPISGNLAARDPDGDALTFSAKLVSGPGTFTLDDPATGAYTFVPSRTDRSPALIEFRANDGIQTGNLASLVFPGWKVGAAGEVQAASHGHLAQDPGAGRLTGDDHRYSVHESGTLQVYTSKGLLASPNPSPGISINCTPVEPPRRGSVSVHPDGSFTYTAQGSGIDWFTCRTEPEGDYQTAFFDVEATPVTLWFESWKPGDPDAVLPAAPASAKISMKCPDDLPRSSQVTLSVPDRVARFVKVYDRDPRQSGGKLLFGGDTGKSAYTWTIGEQPELPPKVYGVGPDTPQEPIVFMLAIAVGRTTLGDPPSSQPAMTQPAR